MTVSDNDTNDDDCVWWYHLFVCCRWSVCSERVWTSTSVTYK